MRLSPLAHRHSPYRIRIAQTLGQTGIRPRLTVGDVMQNRPDRFLERRAPLVQGNGKITQPTREVRIQLFLQSRQHRVGTRLHLPSEKLLEPHHLGGQHGTVIEFQQANGLLGGPGQHGPHGGRNGKKVYDGFFPDQRFQDRVIRYMVMAERVTCMGSVARSAHSWVVWVPPPVMPRPSRAISA